MAVETQNITNDTFIWKNEIRNDVFAFMHFLNNLPLITPPYWFSLILTSVELVQALGLLFLSTEIIQWNGAIEDLVATISSRFRLGFITDPGNASSALVWSIHVVLIITILYSIVIGKRIREKRNWNYGISILLVGGFCHSICTILFVPIVVLLVNNLQCFSITCYDFGHVLSVILTGSTLLSFVLFSVVIVSTVFDQDPCKGSPNNGPYAFPTAGRLIVTSVTALLLLLCPQSIALYMLFLIIISVSTGYVAYLYTYYQPFYSKNYVRFMAVSSWVICWTSLCKVFTSTVYLLQGDDTGASSLYLFGVPLIILTIPLMCDMRRSKVIGRSVEDIKSELELEMKVRFLLQDKAITSELLHHCEELWTDCISRYPTSAKAYMYRGNFYERRIKRPYLALAMYNKALSLSTTFFDQALSSRGQYNIASLHLGQVFARILNYEKDLDSARSFDIASSRTSIAFWDEASASAPDATKLYNLMTKLSTEIEKTESCYQRVLDNAPDDVSSLREYAGFLINTINDVKGGEQVATQAMNSYMAQHKKGESVVDCSNSMHVLLSTDEKSIGEIVTISNTLCKLLGHVKSDLEGTHLALLAPIMFRKSFHISINNICQQVECESQGVQQKFIALQSSGFLLILVITFKYFADLDRLFILGSVQEGQDTAKLCQLLVEVSPDGRSHSIIFCTAACSDLLGISSDMLQYQKPSITSWIPNYYDGLLSFMSTKGGSSVVKVCDFNGTNDDRILTANVHVAFMKLEALEIGVVTIQHDSLDVNLSKGNAQEIVQPDNAYGDYDAPLLSARSNLQLSASQTNTAKEQIQSWCPEDDDSNELSSSFKPQIESHVNGVPGQPQSNGASAVASLISQGKVNVIANDESCLTSSETESSSDTDNDGDTCTQRKTGSELLRTSSIANNQGGSTTKANIANNVEISRASENHLYGVRLSIWLVLFMSIVPALLLVICTDMLLAAWISKLTIIEDSGLLRYLTVSLAMLTNALVHHRPHHSVPDDLAAIRQELIGLADQFDFIGNSLFEIRSELDDRHRDLLFKTVVPVRKIIDTTQISDSMTLWDATRFIVLSSRFVAANDPFDLMATNRHAYFILENYLDPILHRFNDSTFEYVNAANAIVRSAGRVTLFLMLGSLSAVFFITLVIIRPRVWQIEKDSVDVLMRILDLPAEITAQRKTRSINRLLVLGGTTEDRARKRDNNQDAMSEHPSSKTHGGRPKNLLKELKRRSLRQRIRLTGRIFIPAVLLLVYFPLFYRLGYSNIQTQLKYSPAVVNMSSYQRTAVRQVLFNGLILSDKTETSTNSSMANAIAELAQVHDSLIYGSLLAQTPNLIETATYQSQDDILFSNSCAFIGNSCDQVFNGLLVDGLHVSLLSFIQDSQSLLNLVSNFTSLTKASKRLLSLESDYLQVLMALETSMFITSVNDDISNHYKISTLLLTIAFIIILAAIYKIMLGPLLNELLLHESCIGKMRKLLHNFTD